MATDVMTTEELAEYLKLDPQTVYRKFRKGELPGVRIGKSIRFNRQVIDGWLRVMSYRWDPKQREGVRRWAQRFAKQRGIREKDIMDAIRARRYRRE
jgi:excisionase family DNA binding protein